MDGVLVIFLQPVIETQHKYSETSVELFVELISA